MCVKQNITHFSAGPFFIIFSFKQANQSIPLGQGTLVPSVKTDDVYFHALTNEHEVHAIPRLQKTAAVTVTRLRMTRRTGEKMCV